MIVCCGEALVDMVPARCEGNSGYVPKPGGSPYNVAIGLGRLEIPVGFLGSISVDFFGELLVRHLRENGVDLRSVVRSPSPTAPAFVHPAAGKEPVFQFYGTGTADVMLSLDDLPTAFPPEVVGLHFGSISLLRPPASKVYEHLMRREHRQRVISLDPNVRPAFIPDRAAFRARLEDWVCRVDLVRASRADVAWVYPGEPIEGVARRWVAAGAGLVVVTLGEEGAVGCTAASTVRVPAHRVQVVDTVGAGDAFTAALLAWLVRTGWLDRVRDLPEGALFEALTYAARAAALTCTRQGADPPYRRELERSS